MNRYPLWKNIMLITVLVIGIIYAAPNLFGEDPAVQISTSEGTVVDDTLIQTVKQILAKENISYLSINKERGDILVRFANTDIQLQARDNLKAALGEKYIVAINLAPRTPKWLDVLGADPMKLGLDLRGGVHFLLEVDVNSLLKARETGDMRSMTQELRQADVRYAAIQALKPQGIVIDFRDIDSLNEAISVINKNFPDYQITKDTKNNHYQLKTTLLQPALVKTTDYAIDQTMSILQKRVNELGVSDAVVQRQGADHVSVDLPGIQDTARAKDIIGKTATLKFQMVDVDSNVQSAAVAGVPIGSRLYEYEGHPVLLKDRVILRGDSITYATASFSQDGRPSVNIRLGGGGESQFSRVTTENIGKPMAVVYAETKSETTMVDGKPITTHRQVEQVINIATIQSALGNNFEITGLENSRYAQNLALLLRSGALVAPVDIVQEMTVGPSLGAANIHRGIVSLEMGMLLVSGFMLFYYRLFGLFANMALVLNLIFIVAILSILGATLTLPGIAAMVLTVGMAVDANVLINERIREELRNGLSPQASIYTGYERAFSTIVDSNVTTLIVAVVLFSLGSGPVKGFAVTLIIGLLTSMMTAVVFTRAVVNLIYGRRSVKQLSIGIKV